MHGSGIAFGSSAEMETAVSAVFSDRAATVRERLILPLPGSDRFRVSVSS